MGSGVAPNFHHVSHCCTENHYAHFRSKRLIIDMLPMLLSLFQALFNVEPIKHMLFVTQTCNNLIDTSLSSVDILRRVSEEIL